jgi:hypothetical protein
MERVAAIIASAPQGITVDELASLFGKSPGNRGIHLAILVEPFLSYIMEGRKTIESRFSKHKVAPYKRVKRGDAILLKRSGGPIAGCCEVEEAMYFQLDPETLAAIKDKYGREICAPVEFWKEKESSSYATLLKIRDVMPVLPGIAISKNDQRGWIVLRASPTSPGLDAWK